MQRQSDILCTKILARFKVFADLGSQIAKNQQLHLD